MGRSLARRLAARGDRLFLLGNEEAELEASVGDLRARAGKPESVAGSAACDLEKPETFAPALDRAEAALGRLDAVVVTAGAFPSSYSLPPPLSFPPRPLSANLTT